MPAGRARRTPRPSDPTPPDSRVRARAGFHLACAAWYGRCSAAIRLVRPGPSRYDPPTCRVHRLYALKPSQIGAQRRVDAQEIKAAVAHQAAVAAAADSPFVNRRDPALALGPDGRPARSRRAPIWEDVPD